MNGIPVPSGDFSHLKVTRGALKEYTVVSNPLELEFDFNPASITRTRSVTVKTGNNPATAGGYDFENEAEAPRAAQGVTVNAETFTVKILLDATDRMVNETDTQAHTLGVQPEIDILRSMLEPKLQTPDGAHTLAAMGQGSSPCEAHPYPSVLEFIWGVQQLPVFMTQVQIELKAFLPTLVPYRAEATLTLRIIESINPLYTKEVDRQMRSAGMVSGP
ncbi:MAG: hypothetical protein OER85_09745 [Gammaproteobacteria bacterium]|nr:hypothetical protein [Gammaproteobacteria bacterium]